MQWRSQEFHVWKKEPIWLLARLAKKLGHIARAARRLRWDREQDRIALYHAEWNVPSMARERFLTIPDN